MKNVIHPLIRSVYPTYRKTSLLVGLIILFFSSSQKIHGQGTWTNLTNLSPNTNDGPLIVLSDGSVLCKTAAGGGVGKTWNRLMPPSANNYQSATWGTSTTMINDRKRFSSQVLKDARLYVCGGETGAGSSLAEIYNPVTNTWSAIGIPGALVSDAYSEILEDGSVLQTFGSSNSHLCKIYNPTTNVFAAAASSIGVHTDATAHKLPDGSILLIDRMIGQNPNTERYFPATNTWAFDTPLTFELWSVNGPTLGSSIMLPDGRIFVVGGNGNTALYTPSGSSANGTWAAGPTIPGGYAQPDGPIAIGRDGIVLFTASPVPIAGNSHQNPTRFYEFNYNTNTLTQINGPLGLTLPSNTSNQTHLVNLPTGQILMGIEGSNQYYLYTPAGSGLSTLRPTITSWEATCNSYMLYGTKFNGKSLGSGEGGEGQNATNYPMVRLSSGATIYFARSFNWNSTLPNSTGADTTEFILPASLPNGSYNLAVIVNGLNNLGTNTFTTYPQLTSASSLTICSGDNFLYTPSFDRSCVTSTWTRAAVAGISNAAVTIPQSGSINENLINTTSTSKSVVYSYIISHQGYADTVNVTVTVQAKPNVGVSPASFCASGSPTTLTASGATSYTWSPGTTGTTQIFSPTSATLYRVIGSYATGCSDTAYSKAYAVPTVTVNATDPDICPGSSMLIQSNVVLNSNDSLLTSLSSNVNSNSNVFNITANTEINIHQLKMYMNSLGGSVSCQVWYKPGGYGNANLTSSAGWTQLGSAFNVIGAGPSVFTTMPLPTSLTIPAGQTYGIVISCNTLSFSLSTSSASGSNYISNDDLTISVGHAGSTVLGGAFNFTTGQRIWCGEIGYSIPNAISSYNWSPVSGLNNSSIANPTASPASSTTYTVTVIDNHLCASTASVSITPHGNPSIQSVIANPTVLCEGATGSNEVLAGNFIGSVNASVTPDNVGTALAFDVTAKNDILLSKLNTNISSPATSVQVWYKLGGYGTANFTGTAGWTQLGANLSIVPLGTAGLSQIILPSSISVLTGQTMGIMIITNTTNSLHHDLTGTSGNTFSSNDDMLIKIGHAASSVGLNFNLANRAFCGSIGYEKSNPIASYQWQPLNIITNNTQNNAVVTYLPSVTTTFTVQVTDIFGCTNTATKKVYVQPKPNATIAVVPSVICSGDTADLTVTPDVNKTDSLITVLNNQSAQGGNVFNLINGNKAITLSKFKLHLSAAVTQVEIWYKPGGYGNANFTGTVGWTKLGTTQTVSSAGPNNLTTVTPSVTLSIPFNQTYGILLVTNNASGMLSSIGTSVGTLVSSSPEFSITEGHAGTGIGAFAMTVSPRVWNGEIIYSCNNALTAINWTPDTSLQFTSGGLNHAYPTASAIYSLTLTDQNSCTQQITAPVSVYTNLVGTASANPTALCSGNSITLNYNTPSGNQCLGVPVNNFNGLYAPANWSTTLTNAIGGNVNTTGAPNSITINGSSGNSEGFTAYSITTPCNGIVSFDWSTSNSTDATGSFDYPMYSINGGANILFPGYNNTAGSLAIQNGTVHLLLSAGQTLSLKIRNSVSFGVGSVTITNFKAPGTSILSQFANWYTAPSGGTLVGNTIPATVPATTTQTYYAEITTAPGGCLNPVRVATNEVVVTPGVVLTVSASATTICENSSTTMNATGNAISYTWQPGNLSGANVNVSPSISTQYTVTATAANGCTKTSLIQIIVNPAPAITGSASPGIVCPGGNVTLQGTTPNVTWNWQPGNLSGSVVVVNPIVQTTYTVTATNAFGCSSTQTFVLLMHPTPNVTTTVTPAATICAGDFATITASGALSYSWQPGGGVGANLLVTLANTYTVTGTNAQGCTSTSTQQITVNLLPTVNASASQTTICENSLTTLNASGTATNYSWQPGNLTGSSVSVSPHINTTYTVTGTNANGCSQTSTVFIAVNPEPTISGSASPGIVCPGGNVTITGTNPNVTYNWQPGNLNGNIIVVNPIVQTTYTVTVTNSLGCTNTLTFVVLMHPTPNVTTSVSPSAVLCGGGSATITASGANSYTWQPGGSTGASLVVTSANVYTVTGTNAQGCTASSTRAITLTTLPNITASATPATICSGNSSTLQAVGVNTDSIGTGMNNNFSGQISFNLIATNPISINTMKTHLSGTTGNIQVWYRPGGMSSPVTIANGWVLLANHSAIVGAGVGALTPIPLMNSLDIASGQTVGFAVLTNTIGYILNSNPGLPFNTVIASNSDLAITTGNIVSTGGTAFVTSNVKGWNGEIGYSPQMSSYVWQPGNLNGSQVIVSPNVSTTYTCTATNITGCTSSSTVSVSVNQVSISTTSTSICNGNTAVLTASGAQSYTWEPGNATGAVITVGPTVTTTYTVTGTTAQGCTATSEVTINVSQVCLGKLNLRCFIEGYYDLSTSEMNPVLLNQNVAGATGTHSDSITVELHLPFAPYALVKEEKVLLTTQGTALVNFGTTGMYYVVLKPRNGIETWSANPVGISVSPGIYDFTLSASQAYGDNQKEVEPNVFALFSGDVNQDLAVDAFDYLLLDPDVIAGAFGYVDTDLTGDGIVDAFDYIILDANLINGVGAITP
jgi:hypothetical protein